MRDRDTTSDLPDLTSEAPAFACTLLTCHEREARRTLMLAAGKLAAIRADLWNLHLNLEMPEEEVAAIAEGERPETFALLSRAALNASTGATWTARSRLWKRRPC